MVKQAFLGYALTCERLIAHCAFTARVHSFDRSHLEICMPPFTSREIRLRSRPQGRPEAANFALETVVLEPPQEDQVLVRNTYLSVDPCMFCRMRGGKSYLPPFELGMTMEGGAVGTVVESRSETFKTGDVVISNLGWREGFVAPADAVRQITRESHPLSIYLGTLGLQRVCSWASAYLIHVKPGGALLVSGTAEVQGSVASLLANLRGCRIIGSAGSRDMVAFLRDDCGFDMAFDYKSGPILEQLDDELPFIEKSKEASLEAALGICMAGSVVAKTTPGVRGHVTNLPLPIYLLSQSQEAETSRANRTAATSRRTLKAR